MDAVWWFDTDVSANFGMPHIELMNAIGDTVMFTESTPYSGWEVIYSSANHRVSSFWSRVYNILKWYYLHLYSHVKSKRDAMDAVYSTYTFGLVAAEAKKTKSCRIGCFPNAILQESIWRLGYSSFFIHHHTALWKR